MSDYLNILENDDREFRKFVITKLIQLEQLYTETKKWEKRFYKFAGMVITAALSFIAIKGGV
jgi:L-lactate utilization protein LutC